MHRVGSLVALAIGIACLFAATQLSIGDLTEPGPGLWPGVVSCVLIVAAVVNLFTDRGEDYEALTRRAILAGVGLLSLIVFVALFLYIGFILPGLGLFVVWLRFIGKESWRFTLAFSVGTTAVVYVLFVVVLRVPFPEDVVAGIWGGG